MDALRTDWALDWVRRSAAVVAEHPALVDILPRCAVLVDGVRTDGDLVLDDADLIDVLPPFAGG